MVTRTRKIQLGWLAVIVLTLIGTLVCPQGVWTRAHGEHPDAGVLLPAEQLKAMMDRQDPDLRIIDFRHQAKYYLGHIPGAIQVWRPEIPNPLAAAPGKPSPRMQMEKLLGRLGVACKNTLVIYSDQCDHTHLWWLLACYGFPLDRLKLLDGGLEAWKRKGYPTQLTAPRLKPATFKFPPEGRPALLATLTEVKMAQAASESSVILDVRPKEQYLGERSQEGAARRGHIPGARWIYWQDARGQEGPSKGCWQSPAEIRQLYGSRGVTPDKDVYIYGHTERCAAYSLVSLYLAGYPLDKLHVYAGSWIQWSRSDEPVATGVGPAR